MQSGFSFDELRQAVSAGEIDTVLVVFPDMQGRLIGKRFHAAFFMDGGHTETHACDYLLANDIDMEPVPGYAAHSWDLGYGDFVMKPDMSTLRRCTWLDATAMVLCDVLDHHHHEPLPHGPRAMLKRQMARLESMGLSAMAASELEFYLFDEDYRTLRDRRYQGARTAGDYIEDYHIFQTTKEEDVVRAMRNHLQKSGIPVENSKGEWGPGQEELNIRYSDVLTMADRHTVMKNAMKEIAHAHGKSITFMAKWAYDLAGNSCHIHMSLWDKDASTPRFFDPDKPYGMSDLMRQFMAGQLKYASEITYFLAPYINSYKRFQDGTFAPTKIIWSRDNRTAGFRLCGEGTKAIRVECRIPGGDANPYLAYSALLAAGIAGIEEGLELPEPFVGDAYGKGKLKNIPTTLREATALLKKSKMLRAALGDAVVDHYVHTADWEQLEYDRRVTDWELMRGFERY
ncbi:glutamine synthetase family protein [Roseospira navarrensis]|uniref:Glutamine synthetase n=1 Tax=Roseospira navarrensis TaxID=140058 RepID=A0A7X2D4G8_9PROT|nr:glutamine synthetase family protein [Roseospira navarrensis]MQX37851.1 glutamine synthetase [Roseospira navarrensis]